MFPLYNVQYALLAMFLPTLFLPLFIQVLAIELFSPFYVKLIISVTKTWKALGAILNHTIILQSEVLKCKVIGIMFSFLFCHLG